MTDLDSSQTDCPFCGDHVGRRIVKEYGTAIAVRDKNPEVWKWGPLIFDKRG